MDHKSVLLAALITGLLPVAAVAQASPAVQPAAAPAVTAPAATAAPTQPPAPAPTAYPAKVALIAFEQAVIATNEGQQTLADVQKKYAPKKATLDALAAEIDTLKKQLQAAPATLSDTERAARLKTIDTKDKQYQRDADDASTAYNADVQEALSKVMQKVDVVLRDYVEKNGYTLLLDVGGQQSPVMWTSPNPNADITEAVVAAYNASSGVAAPPPAAPTPAAKPKPATTTTPHPAAPK
jgi:Skp family chaperone for outer membrane proteins